MDEATKLWLKSKAVPKEPSEVSQVTEYFADLFAEDDLLSMLVEMYSYQKFDLAGTIKVKLAQSKDVYFKLFSIALLVTSYGPKKASGMSISTASGSVSVASVSYRNLAKKVCVLSTSVDKSSPTASVDLTLGRLPAVFAVEIFLARLGRSTSMSEEDEFPDDLAFSGMTSLPWKEHMLTKVKAKMESLSLNYASQRLSKLSGDSLKLERELLIKRTGEIFELSIKSAHESVSSQPSIGGMLEDCCNSHNISWGVAFRVGVNRMRSTTAAVPAEALSRPTGLLSGILNTVPPAGMRKMSSSPIPDDLSGRPKIETLIGKVHADDRASVQSVCYTMDGRFVKFFTDKDAQEAFGKMKQASKDYLTSLMDKEEKEALVRK